LKLKKAEKVNINQTINFNIAKETILGFIAINGWDGNLPTPPILIK
jgi:hypothetical protein